MVSATGLPTSDVQVALRRLYDAGYLAGIDVTTMGSGFELLDIQLLERGSRDVDEWPTEDSYAALLSAIDARLDEAEGAEKGRLERLRDVVVDVGSTVISKVLKDLLTGM